MSKPTRFHQPERLTEYDYTTVGSYFVTIVTRGRECCLGQVIGDRCELSEYGTICKSWWEWLPQQYTFVKLDELVIMPNHIHGIIKLENSDPLAANVPLPLGKIVAAFKTKTTAEINKQRNTPGCQFWQDGFHDRIIRGRDEYNRVAEYIAMNPLRWQEDVENPNSGL